LLEVVEMLFERGETLIRRERQKPADERNVDTVFGILGRDFGRLHPVCRLPRAG